MFQPLTFVVKGQAVKDKPSLMAMLDALISVGYTCVCICQNSLNYTLRFGHSAVRKFYLNE